MKRTFAALTVLIFLFCSCASPGRKMAASNADLGQGEVIVTGKITVLPPFTDAEQDLTGAGADDYRNIMVLLNGRIYKKVNGAKTQALTGREWEGRINAKMGEQFYAVFTAGEPVYFLSGAVCTKYYWITVPGTTTWVNMGGQMVMQTSPPTQQLNTKFEYVPLNYKIETGAAGRAVYIGDITVYRDEFNKITKIEVVDNLKKAEENFKKNFNGISLVKALAKDAPEKELVQPTEADYFLNSGVRKAFAAGYSVALNGTSGFINIESRFGYQFSRNFIADIGARIMVSPQFFSFPSSDFGNGVSIGSIDVPITAGANYYFFDGTVSPYIMARLGIALDMSTQREMANFFKVYKMTNIGAGMRFSLDTQFDLMLEAELAVYDFVPCMVVPKLLFYF